MNWVLEQFERGQWLVVGRYPDMASAKRAMAKRAFSTRSDLRVHEKPLA